MANTKISALGSGSTPQAADEFVIARAGANYKLTYASLFANVPSITIDDANFNLDIVSSNPRITLDSGDYIEWLRTTNVLSLPGNIGIGTTTPDVVTGSARAMTLSTGATTGYASFELQGRQTTDTAVGVIRFLNVANYVGQIGVVRSGADNSAEFRILLANAGTIALKFAVAKDGTTYFCGDANLYLWVSAGNPIFNLDSTDFLTYDRANNGLALYVGGTPRFQMGNGYTVTYNNGTPAMWMVDSSKGANLKNVRILNNAQDIIFSKVNDDFATATELGRFASNGRVMANAATPFGTLTAATNGAGASAGTLSNAPAAGNPTKWVPFDDNGTTRYIPMW